LRRAVRLLRRLMLAASAVVIPLFAALNRTGFVRERMM
jgi:hypothetical protein